MERVIRIGTRESQLAVWQATLVQDLLKENGYSAELVYIKSEGDIDLVTPLYEMVEQGWYGYSWECPRLLGFICCAYDITAPGFVGWVERSDTHQFVTVERWVSRCSTHPT